MTWASSRLSADGEVLSRRELEREETNPESGREGVGGFGPHGIVWVLFVLFSFSVLFKKRKNLQSPTNIPKTKANKNLLKVFKELTQKNILKQNKSK